MLSERQLDPKTIDIRTRNNTLVLIASGAELPIAQIVRCFPFSTPDRWISLRDPDDAELGLLPSLDGLSKGARALLEARIKDRYNMPTVARVHRVESSTQGATWHVDTDDGPASFTVRGDRGIDITGFPRILFTDVQTRTRFAIPDFTVLDRASQKLARVYLPMGFRGRGRGHRGRF